MQVQCRIVSEWPFFDSVMLPMYESNAGVKTIECISAKTANQDVIKRYCVTVSCELLEHGVPTQTQITKQKMAVPHVTTHHANEIQKTAEKSQKALNSKNLTFETA